MFPTLYTTKSTGKVQEWRIWVETNKIWRTDGQVGGKMKEPIAREISGNTLRTAEQQALLEAEKYWIKQIDKGYKPDPKDTKGVDVYEHVMSQKSHNGGMNRGVKMFETTQIITGTTSGEKNMTIQHHPMLSKGYLDCVEKVVFPCYVQPKLDGLRALGQLVSTPGSKGNCKVMLESRNGKDYVHLNHIRQEIFEFLKGYPDTILDGELYVHEMDGKKNVERFQFLSEACKITRTKPHEMEKKVEYWIFDVWNPETTYEERYKFLKKMFKGYTGTVLKFVTTKKANSHEEIEEFMNKCISEDYEGIMVRNTSAKYVSKNNYHCSELLKYKRFEDEEWTIAGAEECEGTQKGAIKWICERDGKTVIAKQMGSVETSRKMWEKYQKKPKKFIGKSLNIRFNDRSKDGVPRFPRATVVREDV